MENNAKKRSKKAKGFTLVELIAVIAILGILAVIIVPKVGAYTGKAKTSAIQADARTVLNAIEAYNADNQDAQISLTSDEYKNKKVSELATDSKADETLKSTAKRVTSDVKNAKLSDLEQVAKDGKITTTTTTP